MIHLYSKGRSHLLWCSGQAWICATRYTQDTAYSFQCCVTSFKLYGKYPLVCVCGYMCVGRYMGMVFRHLCVKLKVNIGCLPAQLSTLSFKTRSLSKPRDYPLITQTGHPSPVICLFLQGLILLSRLALQMYTDPLNFHVGSRNWNPYPCACTLHLPNHLSNFYALFF